jgi:hypothetical protein
MLIVPGLRDHVENHWQTLLEKRHRNARSVPPLEYDKMSCAARVAALDAALGEIEGPVILIAHSAGVITTVHWAQHHNRPIKAALFAVPPDFESPLPEGYPTQDVLQSNGWLPVPRRRLPFPSIVAASTNDPLAHIERVSELAAAWGSRLVNLGPVGHLNPASGYGAWTRADEFIAALS